MYKEVIKKVGGKYVLYPKSGGKRLGTFRTKAAAKRRDRQINYFKHKKG
jgi:hypothetical protein